MADGEVECSGVASEAEAEAGQAVLPPALACSGNDAHEGVGTVEGELHQSHARPQPA